MIVKGSRFDNSDYPKHGGCRRERVQTWMNI